MMISDEERREVARKLRSLDESIDGVPLMCTKQEHNAMALGAIRAVVGEGDIFHLLADLIDRPTTKREWGCVGRMTFSEYMQLSERAEAAGIGDDKSLAQLLHYIQFQEVATRNFQAYMNEMESWCKNISNTVESRIKEAEKVIE